jgi:uncharacterized protein
MRDRVGIGWRPALAAGILANVDRIDLVEVIADDWFAAGRRQLRALRTLGAQVPVVLHGVGLGLASSGPVDARRLAAMARIVEAVRPEFWSEHLAFVRAGGHEIGHLAAPPRTAATIEGAAVNIDRARKIVGSAPLLENIATLIDPPGSDRDEAAFVVGIAKAADAELLLDLHNLHANATNFAFDPLAFLDALPTHRIRAVHLAGGRWISASSGERRLLDDHVHEVPETVFTLLEELGARSSRPLTVIVERDGNYPTIAILLEELDRARGALVRGRARRVAGRASVT